MIAQWFANLGAIFRTIRINDIVDIIAITFVVFSLFKLIRETRAEQLLKGVIILLAIYLLSMLFGLTMLTGLLRMLFEFAVIIIVIIFQPELRKALERIGKSNFGRKYLNLIKSGKTDEEVTAINKAIVAVSDASLLFSSSRTGALIVFERDVKLSDIADTGTILDSAPSVALIGNVFFNKAPLHDGAMIIRDGRVYAAGCILPLTAKNKDVDINLGTRHRAALGMSELSDAVIVVISEETGSISVANDGKLFKDFDRESLVEQLQNLLLDDTKVYVKRPSLFSSKRKENRDDE